MENSRFSRSISTITSQLPDTFEKAFLTVCPSGLFRVVSFVQLCVIMGWISIDKKYIEIDAGTVDCRQNITFSVKSSQKMAF